LSLNLNILFVLTLGLILLLFLFWAFRNLPRENWQVLACVPRDRSRGETRWGTNYTWYGFFLATAYVFAVFVFLILMGSLGAPKTASLDVPGCFPLFDGPAFTLSAVADGRNPYSKGVGIDLVTRNHPLPASVVADHISVHRTKQGDGGGNYPLCCQGEDLKKSKTRINANSFKKGRDFRK